MISDKCFFIGNKKGFTLVELMITLAMSGIIVAAIYSAYIIQQKTYYTQGQVVDMQQNLRAAMEVMESEIRMAGYDPSGNKRAGITTVPTSSQLSFSYYSSEDVAKGPGNPDVNIVYSFDPADGPNAYGIVNKFPAAQTVPVAFRRNINGGGLQDLAEGIQAIEFCYVLDGGSRKTNLVLSELDKIMAIQITMLAVASQRDPKYTNTETYDTACGAAWTPTQLSGSASGDNFRRRLLTSSVNLRNHL